MARENVLTSLMGGGSVPGDSPEEEVEVGSEPAATPEPDETETQDDEDEAGPDEGEQADESEESDDSDQQDDEDQTDEETSTKNDTEELARLRQERDTLLEAVLAQSKPKDEKPKLQAPPRPDVPVNVLKAALFGAPQEVVDKFPRDQWAKAQQLAEEHAGREAEAALDPTVRYSSIRNKVIEDVFQILAPVLTDYNERMAKDSVQQHLAHLDPATQAKAKTIYHGMSGSKSPDWSVQRETIKAAAAMAENEALKNKLKQGDAKAGAAKAQKNAAGGGKLKPNKPANTAGGQPKIPPMRKGERYSDYADRIRALLQ